MRLLLLPCLSAVLSIPPLSAGVTKELLVADYKTVGDDQSNDGPAIQRTFAAAKRAGSPTTVILEKKRYLLGDNPDSWHYFVMEGFKDLVIEGNGVPDARNIRISGNRFEVGRKGSIRIHGIEDLTWRDNTLTKNGMPITNSSEMVTIDGCSKKKEHKRPAPECTGKEKNK